MTAPEPRDDGARGDEARRDAARRDGARRDGGRPAGAKRRPLGRFLSIAALLALAAGGWAWWQLSPPDPTASGPVVFDLEPGWGAARAARELEAAGLIRNATLFTLYLRVMGLDRSVGEGLYDLSPASSASEVAMRLDEGGRPRTALMVVPEGFRASDVAERLDELGVQPAEAVLARVGAPGPLAPAWLPDGAGLEGYLFPDSYELRMDATVDEVLAVMVEHFETRVDAELRERAAAAGLGPHELTILASMVQAEAAGPEEMGIVAGVFLNRLDEGMRLQSDPTVAYGLGKDLPELSVSAGDMTADHPWNTYVHPGLPVGPIGNPGIDAVRAVLAPERRAPGGERWMYFLHGFDDGEPVFRPNTDLAGHERDIERYLR